VVGWFITAFIAFLVSVLVGWSIVRFGIGGIAMGFAINQVVRRYFSRRSDRHEERYHPEEKAGT